MLFLEISIFPTLMRKEGVFSICKKVVLVKLQIRSRYQLKVSCSSAHSPQPTSGALAVESFSTTACTVCVGDFESARGGLGVAEVIIPTTAEFAPELAAVLQIFRLVFTNLFPNNLDFSIFFSRTPRIHSHSSRGSGEPNAFALLQNSPLDAASLRRFVSFEVELENYKSFRIYYRMF